MIYYAYLDKMGKILGWYCEDVHGAAVPTPHVKVTEDVWRNAINVEANAYIDNKFVAHDFRTPDEIHKQGVDVSDHKKAELLSLASKAIEPLQDAVDLDIATNDELAQLKEWKKFRVLVNRVDTSLAPDIDWPQKPERCKGK